METGGSRGREKRKKLTCVRRRAGGCVGVNAGVMCGGKPFSRRPEAGGIQMGVLETEVCVWGGEGRQSVRTRLQVKGVHAYSL
jgi:hypothetical protein